MGLKDKVAIVTGATSGIGLAAARHLAELGAMVAVVGRDPAKTQQVAEDLAELPHARVAGFACDVSSEEQVERAVDQVIGHFGALDVVVNNAGMMLFKRLEEFTAAEWQRVFSVDFYGAVFFAKQAMQKMRQGGSIVNVSSIHANQTTPLVTPYAAAKAAVLSLTRSTAIEGAEKGIRANAVLPGAIDTPMLWENPNIRSGVEKIKRRDLGQPEDVASAVVFLASDVSRFITGETLRVDGGRLARL